MALRGIPLGVRGFDGDFALGSFAGYFGMLEILAQGGDCWVYGPKSEPSGRHGHRHGRAAGWHGHQLALGRRKKKISEGSELARSDRASWHDRATLVKPRFLGFRDLGFAVERKTLRAAVQVRKRAILSSLFHSQTQLVRLSAN